MKDAKLKGFMQHGVKFTGGTDKQRQGTCPFCDKPYKFYVNKANLLWDCKSCQISGNFYSFLKRIHAQNLKDTVDRDYFRLHRSRKLPVAAFKAFGVAYNGTGYTLPIYNSKNSLVDLRIYKIKQRVISTAGCSTGLLNAHLLTAKKHLQKPVYVCEGEFDCIALQHLLTAAKAPGIVVAVPGANTFKADWPQLFSGREVTLLYDNDEAGEAGEKKAYEMLQEHADVLRCVNWPADKPSGYDTRDYIIEADPKFRTPKRTLRALKKLARNKPRSSYVKKDSKDEEPEEEVIEYKTLQDVYDIYNKWLYIKNFSGITVSLATIISQSLSGDPLWLFLVSPPGGSKTEILSTYNACDNIFTTSSLTPQSLISGANFTGSGRDPSLIPKLNGKILIVKDFTSILSKRDVEKEEIFGILRDAFDGYCSKQFGTGVTRSYKSHFTILAGVTPAIYESGAQQHSLGERFLKFAIGDNLEHHAEDDIIGKAIDNINSEGQMREELAHTVRHFILRKKLEAQSVIPIIPPNIKEKIIALARFGARMRGTVSREKYRPDLITAKPSAEVGSRLGKQIAKLAISLAVAHDRDVVNEDDYALCRKCVLDTINQRNEDVVRTIYKATMGKIPTMRPKDITTQTKYTHTTTMRLLADMTMLDITDRVGRGEYRLTPYMLELIKKADLYTTKDEIERPILLPRPAPAPVKIRKRKAKK